MPLGGPRVLDRKAVTSCTVRGMRKCISYRSETIDSREAVELKESRKIGIVETFRDRNPFHFVSVQSGKDCRIIFDREINLCSDE